MLNIRQLQEKLKELGFYSGPIDGDRGRGTIQAIRNYQASRGFSQTGVLTHVELDLLDIRGNSDIPWLDRAIELKGVREVPGTRSNPTIMGWADWLKARLSNFYYKNDDIPWCGLFMGYIISYTLPSEKLPSNPLFARNWLKFGTYLPEPKPGAIMVFSRGKASGHVGLYTGETSSSYLILGGNQSNQVSVAPYPKSRLLGIRWPKTAKN
jgi:uncharacterized protein (TIGR02594 family)